jgi:hypothetical protein
MVPKTKSKNERARNPATAAKSTARRRYKGRKVYTERDRQSEGFSFPYPAEPAWEAEWKRRRSREK